MTNDSRTGSGKCTCFVSALHASDELHQVSIKIETLPIDRVLTSIHQAVSVVHQYSICSFCADSFRFPLYAILLRQVTECYQALFQAGSFDQEETKTVKLKIGTFSVDAPIQTAVRAVVFMDVQRTIGAVCELGEVVRPGGVKSAKETWHGATYEYNFSLVEGLKNDLLEIRDEGNNKDRG